MPQCKFDLTSKYTVKTKEDLLEFISFALTYQVDYVYVLEAIQRILTGEQDSWIPDNYIDY